MNSHQCQPSVSWSAHSWASRPLDSVSSARVFGLLGICWHWFSHHYTCRQLSTRIPWHGIRPAVSWLPHKLWRVNKNPQRNFVSIFICSLPLLSFVCKCGCILTAVWDMRFGWRVDGYLWRRGVVGGSSHFPKIHSLATSLLELQNICEPTSSTLHFLQDKMAQQITQRKQQGSKILSFIAQYK